MEDEEEEDDEEEQSYSDDFESYSSGFESLSESESESSSSDASGAAAPGGTASAGAAVGASPAAAGPRAVAVADDVCSPAKGDASAAVDLSTTVADGTLAQLTATGSSALRSPERTPGAPVELTATGSSALRSPEPTPVTPAELTAVGSSAPSSQEVTPGAPAERTAAGDSAPSSPGETQAARGVRFLGAAAQAHLEKQKRRGRRAAPEQSSDEPLDDRERFAAHLRALDAGPWKTSVLDEVGSPGHCSGESLRAPGAHPSKLDEGRQRALDEDVAVVQTVLKNLNNSRSASEPAGGARPSTAPQRVAPKRLMEFTDDADEAQSTPAGLRVPWFGSGSNGELSTADRLLVELRAANAGRPAPYEQPSPRGQRQARLHGGEAAESSAPSLSDYLGFTMDSSSSLSAASPKRPPRSRSASNILQGGQRAARGLDPLMFGSAAGLPRGLRPATAPRFGALAGCLSLYQEVCEKVYDSLQHHSGRVASHVPDPVGPSAAAARARQKAEPYLQDLSAWCRAASGPAARGGERTGAAGQGATGKLCRGRRRGSGPLVFDPSTAAYGDFLDRGVEQALCEHYGVEAPRRRLDPTAPRRRR